MICIGTVTKLEENMKKIFTIVWGVLIGCLLLLMVNYVANESVIKAYKEGVYKENKLAWLGVLEPYISHYNDGNMYYQKGEYEKAVEAYELALKNHPGEKEECMIRINQVLAMVAPIKPDEIDENEVEETIALLEDAKEVLYEHGCATEDDNGHNEQAKQLKKDIDRLLEQLRNNKGDESKKQKKDNDDKKDNKKDDKEEESIKQELMELQKKGNEDRSKEMSGIENVGNFEFYDGKTW